MKINYLNTEHKSIENYIRGCPESERMMLFRQHCYEKRMFENEVPITLNGTTSLVKKLKIINKVGTVFASMGYRDRF